MTRVLVIGGTGFFGQRLCRLLASDPGLEIVVAGRALARAQVFAASLPRDARAVALDLAGDYAAVLARVDPAIVIHTAGPFQGQDYRVPETCVAQGRHYLDLADGRAYVCGIPALDERARARNVAVIAGASTLPALSAAIVDALAPRFARLDAIDHALATAQLARAGAATLAGALSYCGRPFRAPRDGRTVTLRGWRGLQRRDFVGVGRRWVADCDVPDLTLFPARYPTIGTVRFRAGVEVPLLQFGLWGRSWFGPLLGAWRGTRFAAWEARILAGFAAAFDRFGSDRSGFQVTLDGIGHDGRHQRLGHSITAARGDGAFIPTVPAAILARALAAKEFTFRGAAPCMGFMSLAMFEAAIAHLAIETRIESWDRVARQWMRGAN